MDDISELQRHLEKGSKRCEMAYARFLTERAVAEMKGSIRLTWKKVKPHVAEAGKRKTFSLLSLVLVHAWKKGFEEGERVTELRHSRKIAYEKARRGS